MIKPEYKYSETTEKIIGCAMKVHSWFGPGFPEVIYQRSLLIELIKAGLDCESEVSKDVYYETYLVGKRRLDIIVERNVLVELKALHELDTASYNKIINYLKVFKLDVGLLLNFGSSKLQYKRFVH
jgi:GxxExxY protein